MRFKDIKQHKTNKYSVNVEEDRYGNVTVIVTNGVDMACSFNVAKHAIPRTIKKLTKRVK